MVPTIFPKEEAPYVLVTPVQLLLRTGVALGIPREQLLAAAALTEAVLADRDARVPYSQQAALGREIVSRNPGVNIELAVLARVSTATMGLLGYAVQNSLTTDGETPNEAGQLGVIGALLLCFAGLRWLAAKVEPSARIEQLIRRAPIWAMGGLAFAWTVERVLSFWT